jgi:hypothetical protein
MKIGNGKNDDLPPKDRQFDYRDDGEKTQLNLDLKYLRREIDGLERCWGKYIVIDPSHWLHQDTNKDHLAPVARNASQDVAFIFQSLCNFTIDFVLFHNIVDYMIKLGVPNCPEEVVLVMSIIFPIAFFFGEIAANGWIRSAKDRMDLNDRDFGAKLWFIFTCFFGLLLALFPSAAFAYVMIASQEETGQSPLFVIIMAILGVVIHLMVVFGDHVVESRVRLWAKFRDWQLSRARQGAYYQLSKAAGRVEDCNKKQATPMVLAPAVSDITEFVNEGWHRSHPLGRPPKYRFGIYSDRHYHDPTDPTDRDSDN